MIAALFVLQAVTAAAPTTIDLLATPETCRATGEDIVVCARPDDQRIAPLPALPKIGPPDGPLSFRLPGGGSGKLHAVQTNLPGATGQGAAVTLTLPF